jgi:hypothetical protein
MSKKRIVLKETDDGCMVYEVDGEVIDKIDFFSSIYLAQQAYPHADRGPLPTYLTVGQRDT